MTGAEFVITPSTTHVLMEHIHDFRRIYTDGRDWPDDIEPTFAGYSIGKWIDTDGTGRYDVLEVETRGFKGPRVYDNTGLPLHQDNQTIIKERIYPGQGRCEHPPRRDHHHRPCVDASLDGDQDIPRDAGRQPAWREIVCVEDNPHVEIAKQGYMLSADGYLMPTKKDQPPPDLRYFTRSQK